jgi:phosphoribosyl 1,2-cyclic phosphodiesterase
MKRCLSHLYVRNFTSGKVLKCQNVLSIRPCPINTFFSLLSPVVFLRFMALFTSSLASGSNGNCYYIGNATEAVLVDAGIACREIERRMAQLNLSMDIVKGIFISHEHADHIRGLKGLARKFGIPVYSTAATLRKCGFYLNDPLARPFLLQEGVSIGGLTISSFPKFHDAVEPCSFVIRNEQVNIGVFTDIGTPCADVVRHFKQCHAVFLETNYDEQMLDGGNYPYYLKNRIRSGNGHLSNAQALKLFCEHRPPHMSHLFLSHLSKNNNCPKLVQELFHPHAGSTKIILASRFEQTAVYEVSGNGEAAPTTNHHYRPTVQQLQFSFT